MKQLLLATIAGSLMTFGCVADNAQPADEQGGDVQVVFAGAWNPVAGSGAKITSCNGQSSSEALGDADSITLATGTDSDLVVTNTNFPATCAPMTLNVTGNVASSTSNWSCTQNGITVTFTRYTLTLSDDGGSLVGDGALTMQNGSLSCTSTLSGTFRK
jgi:hypothetical protein